MNTQEIHKSESIMLIGFALFGVFSNSFEISLVMLFLVSMLHLLFITSKKSSRAIISLWIKFGELLGYINSRILLSSMFYIIITPIALIRKVFKKSNGTRKNTAFIKSTQVFESTFFEKMW